jgi:hypothetical protein
VAYIFAVAVYLAVTVPSLRTVVTPVDVDTRADRIEAMRILSAGNTIMMVVLGAILVLQVIIRQFLSLSIMRRALSRARLNLKHLSITFSARGVHRGTPKPVSFLVFPAQYLFLTFSNRADKNTHAVQR